MIEIKCTKETPWDKVDPVWHQRVIHIDAKDIGECSDGCCDHFECPNCGHHWYSECGQ